MPPPSASPAGGALSRPGPVGKRLKFSGSPDQKPSTPVLHSFGHTLYLPAVMASRMRKELNSTFKWSGDAIQTHVTAAGITAEAEAVARETRKRNDHFVFTLYVPPAVAARSGVTEIQLQEIRGCIRFLLCVFAPDLMPDEVVAASISRISAMTSSAVSDYIDHRAYSLWRVQTDIMAGKRHFTKRGATLPPLNGSRSFRRWRSTMYHLTIDHQRGGGIYIALLNAAGTRSPHPTTTLYTLRLGNNRWYVGTTTDLDGRLDEHRRTAKNSDDTTKYIRRYGIIGVAASRTIDSADRATVEQAETAEVERLMGVYGVTSVRGGAHLSKLSPAVVKDLQLRLTTGRARRPPKPPKRPMEVSGTQLGERMGELQRFVHGIRNQVARRQKLTTATAVMIVKALHTHQKRGTSEAGAYLANNGFALISAARGKAIALDAAFRLRKPLPAAHWPAFERIVDAHVAVEFPADSGVRHVLSIEVRKKTGVEALILVPTEKQEVIMSQLLTVENIRDFAGLSTQKLRAKLGMFFLGISLAMATRFNENMEVTQLHKRNKRISIPRTVTGEYAGHRFGMDTTFLGKLRNINHSMPKEQAEKASVSGEIEAVLRNSNTYGSAKWWPKSKDLVSFQDFTKTDIHTYASMIERGEHMRALSVEINKQQRKGEDKPMLSPFPYLEFDGVKPGVKPGPGNAKFSCREWDNPIQLPAPKAKAPKATAPKAYSPTCLLTCIDMYSRKAWVYPAPARGTHHVLSSLALRYALADAKMTSAPPVITTDNGHEFHKVSRRTDESSKETGFAGIFNVHGMQVVSADDVKANRHAEMEMTTAKMRDAWRRPWNGRASMAFKNRWLPPKLPGFRLEYKAVNEEVERPAGQFGQPDSKTTGVKVYSKNNMAILRRQMDPKDAAEQPHVDVPAQPFFAYARALGAHTITTTVPMYKKSGAQGPIESFHRTFKLMLGKQTALHASAASNKQRVVTDTWCMSSGDATSSSNLWYVTSTLIAATLDQYNNTYHASIGMTPQQLWDASRMLRAREGRRDDAISEDEHRASEIVAQAEFHMIQTAATKPTASEPYEVGQWVRIHLSAPDRHMSADDRAVQAAVHGEFRKGYDWNWSSRIYYIKDVKRVEGALRLKRRGVHDYDFYTYTVAIVDDPRYQRKQREHEPVFGADGHVRLQQEQLLRVDREFLQSYPRLGRLFVRDGNGKDSTTNQAIEPGVDQRRTFRRLLLAAGYKELRVPGDGDCQFAAVAAQAMRISGGNITADSMRQAAVGQLNRHKADYLDYFDDVAYAGLRNHGLIEPDVPYNADSTAQHSASYDRYTAAMSKPGAWGDNLTLMAMAKHLNIGIRVYRPTTGGVLGVNNVPDTTSVAKSLVPIVLTYNGTDHFNGTSLATDQTKPRPKATSSTVPAVTPSPRTKRATHAEAAGSRAEEWQGFVPDGVRPTAKQTKAARTKKTPAHTRRAVKHGQAAEKRANQPTRENPNAPPARVRRSRNVPTKTRPTGAPKKPAAITSAGKAAEKRRATKKDGEAVALRRSARKR